MTPRGGTTACGGGFRNRCCATSGTALLLHGASAEPRVLLIGNRARILQAFEFLEFVSHAVADHLAKLFASLLYLLIAPLRHPAALRDQVNEHPDIREHNQHDHPKNLA